MSACIGWCTEAVSCYYEALLPLFPGILKDLVLWIYVAVTIVEPLLLISTEAVQVASMIFA